MEVLLEKPMNDYNSLHIFMLGTQSCIIEPREYYSWALSTCVKCYLLWCLDSKKVVLSCDVTFNDLEILKLKVCGLDSSNVLRSRWSLKLP